MGLIDPLNSPETGARHLRTVTPNDGADLPDGVCRALQIGVAGDVKVLAEGDTDPIVVPVQAGTWDCWVRKVFATGTTATGIVAMY